MSEYPEGITIRDGWYQVVTAFPKAETTIAYRYESGGWWIPDPGYNEASLVGARITQLYTQAEVDDARAEAWLLGARAAVGSSAPPSMIFDRNPYREGK